MYHRVNDLLFDPFELAVSPDNFDQQLQVLKTNYKVVPVNELVDRLQKKMLAPNSVCITFDDGYADNYTQAKPLLEKHGCPATFYIASGFAESTCLFWWDELQYILLNTPRFPSSLSLRINGALFAYQLENDGRLTPEDWLRQRTWVFADPPPTQRCGLYVSLWKQLKPLAHREQQAVLAQLKAWAGLNEVFGAESLSMTEHQLQEMSNHPLFDIGVHTNTHPALSLLTHVGQFREIFECKQYLEEKHHKKMQTISYPYGDYNAATLEIVKRQNLRGAFTTDERVVTKRTNPVGMGRFQVKNWTGSEFQQRLHQWFKGR